LNVIKTRRISSIEKEENELIMYASCLLLSENIFKRYVMVKETIRLHLTLVHVFHVYASMDTLWVAHALSHYTPVRYGRIAFVSVAHNATQFDDSICPVCISTFQMLVHSEPTDAGLN
jgi:hypothetical protein